MDMIDIMVIMKGLFVVFCHWTFNGIVHEYGRCNLISEEQMAIINLIVVIGLMIGLFVPGALEGFILIAEPIILWKVAHTKATAKPTV